MPKYTASDGRVTSAYFCHIRDVAPCLAIHCSAYNLLTLLLRGLHRFPSSAAFYPNFFSPGAIASYLQLFSDRHLYNHSNHFKHHSLRNGRHTFYTMKGMSADLRDFLARHVINRCSLRYFRGSPAQLEIYGPCVLSTPLSTTNLRLLLPPSYTKPSRTRCYELYSFDHLVFRHPANFKLQNQ